METTGTLKAVLESIAKKTELSAYEQIRSSTAESAYYWLEKILTDVSVRTKLSAEMELAVQGYQAPPTIAPMWAKELSHKLVDPQGIYSSNVKRTLCQLCNEMIQEYKKRENNVPVLVCLLVKERSKKVDFLNRIATDIAGGFGDNIN